MKILGYASGKSDFERKCSCLMDRIGLIYQTVACFVYSRKYAYAYWLCVSCGQYCRQSSKDIKYYKARPAKP